MNNAAGTIAAILLAGAPALAAASAAAGADESKAPCCAAHAAAEASAKKSMDQGPGREFVALKSAAPAEKAAKPSESKAPSPDVQDADVTPAIESLGRYLPAFIAVPDGIPEEVEIQIPIDGQLETLRLFRTSLRSADAKLLVDVGGGVLREEPLPPHRTYRGSLVSSGETVSASIIDGALHAMIPVDGDIIWVQPISDFIDGRSPNEHVVYRASELETVKQHRCGLDDANLALPDWMQGLPNDPLESNAGTAGDGGGEGGGEGGVAGTSPFIAKIAFDTDFEFFQKNGSSVANTVIDIENVMNNVSLVYDRDVNIGYEYTGFVVRSTASDPYNTSVMNDLLCEFRTKWNSLPESDIPRDIAQIFTGKSIQGSVIGLAWLGVLCNQQGNDCGGFGNLAYSAVESRFSLLNDFRTSLSAHELGHNWQAQHCDSAAPCNIMCSGLNGCQGTTGTNLKFSAGEQTQIINFRNAVGCDVALPAPLTVPFIENFEAASVNASRWTYNKGGAITTAAQNEPSPTRSLVLNSPTANEYADDEIRSNFFQLAGQSIGTVSFFVQHVGVESGEQLVIEYLTNQLRWQSLRTITSDGVNETVFTEFTNTLPANALHNKFRLRFRTLGDQSDDNWYIDNVSVGAVILPPNDECSAATAVGSGTFPFNNTNATNSAVALPGGCDGGVGTTMQRDVWFLYDATCTGDVTVTTCGTTAFNSRIAIYRLLCPTAGSFLGCNNDDPDCTGGGASITFSAFAEERFLIRIGANSTGGAGTLTITCTVPLPCPADLTEDRVVNSDDLGVLLTGWGTAVADITGDGTTNSDDLGVLLSAWGNCP
jgi:hypothetical protein